MLLASAANAQVYKCQEGGRTVITDRPCHADSKPIEVKPAAGEGDRSEYNSPAARRQRDVEYARELQRRADEREARQEIARDYDRRIAEINERQDRRNCSYLQGEIDRYEAKLRAGASAKLYEWYKSEQAAARGRYERECK
ncbi:DUF4124 domain-containing protein [Thauera sp.]|uniref:DUF4124 domain-containing protein n=1 Tax=Thauera sp. TaxID=1905334 RepID=UPI0039E2650C